MWRSHNVTETYSIFGESEWCGRVTHWVDRKKEMRVEYSWTQTGEHRERCGFVLNWGATVCTQLLQFARETINTVCMCLH